MNLQSLWPGQNLEQSNILHFREDFWTVPYSIYSRMTIYIIYYIESLQDISIKYYYSGTINNRYPKTEKLSKPGVHILLPRLRPQHVWPRNKFGKTEFSLYLTTRHRLMPQNHSICFLVSYKWRCPLKWWYPQIINFNGSFHF